MLANGVKRSVHVAYKARVGQILVIKLLIMTICEHTQIVHPTQSSMDKLFTYEHYASHSTAG